MPGLISLSLILLSTHVYGQEKSESNAYNRKSTKTLNQIVEYVDNEPVKAIDLLSNYFESNLKSITRQEEAEIFQLLGRAHYNLNQYDLALQNYERVRVMAQARSKIKSRNITLEIPPSLYYDVGKVYLAQSKWDSAIYELNNFVNQYKNKDSPKGEGLLALSESFLGKGSSDTAMKYVDQTLALAAVINDESLQNRANLIKGRILEAQDDDQSLYIYQQLLDEAIEERDLGTNRNVTEAIGRVLNKRGDFQSTLDFKKEALQNSITVQDTTLQSDLNLEIAELYLSNEQPVEAIPYLNSGLRVSDERGDIEQSLKASKTLSDVYAEQGNYDLALSNYEKYVALVDEQYEKKQKEIELSKKVLESLYKNRETINLLEKDRELNASQIALLEQDRDRKNQMIYGLLALIILILVAGYLLYRSSRQKRLANQLLTLKSLRSQMNPHFIFNALNSVNSFISKNDTRQANKYLSEFSRLMRIVMENSQSDFVPLSEEVSTLKLYLKLEHFRFKDTFDYQFNVDEQILEEEYIIPPMLIQPFIENAIWHGLRYKEAKGVLTVKIKHITDGLKLVIEDNGIGRERSKALKTENQKEQQSTGMKNTENRIALINSTYNVQIRLSVSNLTQDPDKGTRVEVVIPKTLISMPC